MSGIDSKGKHVDALAKPTRAELVQWVDQTSLALSRAKRQADPQHFALARQAELKRHAEAMAKLEQEHAEAPERVVGLTRQLEEWKRQLGACSARERIEPQSVVAERQAEAQALARLAGAGDAEALAKLLRMATGGRA